MPLESPLHELHSVLDAKPGVEKAQPHQHGICQKLAPCFDLSLVADEAAGSRRHWMMLRQIAEDGEWEQLPKIRKVAESAPLAEKLR